MSTITLPNIRVSSDLTVGVVLKDGGVAIDWSTLSNIKAYLYADAQRAMAGRCSVAVDEEDSTRLVCSYRANKPQYIGVNRIVITCTYRGKTKTFDKPALNFVRWTDDQAGQQITIDDPDVDVEIEVEDVSSSILEQAIAAALQAAADAEHAAHLIPNQVLLDCEQATAGANAAAEAANAAGITSVQVSVEDNEPGTPSADVFLVNKVLSIIFHYLKGETGDAAGFGAITATVDDVVGDPSVTVMASGPDTAKVLAFAFHGLRGIQGVPGVANAKYKQVDTLPTASADTMDFIYLTPSGTSGVYNMSYTEQNGSTFTWRDLGTTAIQLSDYATKAELSQLDLKVDDMAIPGNVRQAIASVLENVAFANDDGYSSELATIRAWADNLVLVSIDAVFTQGGNNIYATDSLDKLKQYLVVTANYDDSSSAVLSDNDYSLSGTLAVGTSTITVTYQGKTDTFEVVVSASPYLYVLPSAFTSTGNNSIDTGFKPEKNKTYTILCEAQQSSTSSTAVFIYGNRPNSSASSYVGLACQNNGMWGFGISYNSKANISTNVVRDVVVAEISNEGKMENITHKYKVGSGTIQTVTAASYGPDITGISMPNFTLGARYTDAGFFGTINSFAVYEGEMSAADITNFLNNGM